MMDLAICMILQMLCQGDDKSTSVFAMGKSSRTRNRKRRRRDVISIRFAACGELMRIVGLQILPSSVGVFFDAT